MDNFNQEMDRLTAVLDRMQADVDELKVELDIPSSVRTKEDLATYRHRQALARVQEMLRSTDWELDLEIKELKLDDELVNYSPDLQNSLDLLTLNETVEEELARLQTQVESQLRVDQELSKLNALLSN